MKQAKSIREIYEIVGDAVVFSMVYNLTTGKNKIEKASELVKSIDYDINFQQKDDLGRFKSLSISFFMLPYGLALDKGRQGTEGNKNIRTNWRNGRVTGVPIGALIKFIKKRGLQRKIKGKGGKFISLNQVAFILQNSIKRKGIDPRNFITPALEEGQKVLEFYLDRQLIDLLDIEIGL